VARAANIAELPRHENKVNSLHNNIKNQFIYCSTMDMEIETDRNNLEDMIKAVTSLYERYKSNEYMEPKVYNSACNQFATTLENIEKNRQEVPQDIWLQVC
jgi:DNA repair exonuclease SbcCD ATPase subunit